MFCHFNWQRHWRWHSPGLSPSSSIIFPISRQAGSFVQNSAEAREFRPAAARASLRNNQSSQRAGSRASLGRRASSANVTLRSRGLPICWRGTFSGRVGAPLSFRGQQRAPPTVRLDKQSGPQSAIGSRSSDLSQMGAHERRDDGRRRRVCVTDGQMGRGQVVASRELRPAQCRFQGANLAASRSRRRRRPSRRPARDRSRERFKWTII